jgi:hypothetical protein
MDDDLQMSPPDFTGCRMQHLAAPKGESGIHLPHYVGLAPDGGSRLLQEQLGQRSAARIDPVAIEQRQCAHDLRCAKMKADRGAVPRIGWSRF